MKKFHLHIQAFIEGSFHLKNVNLAFVFQVNCPGCFIYGIPLINDIFNQEDSISVIGISTAFEDFSLNTLENTEKLLKHGEIIGETKRHYKRSKLNEQILFPIAFDDTSTTAEFLTPVNLKTLADNYLSSNNYTDMSYQHINNQLHTHYSNLPYISKTFTLNQLSGTPSFILFDREYHILESWFGHLSPDILRSRIAYHVKNISSNVE